MKSLFEQVISGLNELIQLRTKMSTLYSQLDKSKDATAMQFKIKNYYKWIDALNIEKNKNTSIKSKSDIKALKLTASLEARLIDLFENGDIPDLDTAKTELANLEKMIPESLSNSCTSINSGDDDEEHIATPENVKPPAKTMQNTVTQNTSNAPPLHPISQGIIDTSQIEAVPKILAEIKRPTDPLGAAAYDLRFVHGIGEKNAEKLAKDGITLKLLMDDWNNYVKKDADNAILMFSKMTPPADYGKRHWELMDEGHQRSILLAKLEKKLQAETQYLHKLTSQQLMGLKYFHDMSQKIPREEVQKIEIILKKVAQRLNPDIVVTLCGSYRRGRPRSGDIDCLITHPGIKTKEDLENSETNILAKFVKVLTDVKFIIDHLTDFGKSKYMGFCIINQQGKKNNIARRIDIKFIPYNCFGASILYFTGSKNYNTIMRGYARNKGYSLSEYGLVRLKDNVLIPCPDELDAFTILGYPYKKPEDRDI